MFKKSSQETPINSVINAGLYKISLPYFTGDSIGKSEEEGHQVFQFPVHVHVQSDSDLAKGIFARFIIMPSKQRVAGDFYENLATILRRSYFTPLFEGNEERIKWIEYRSAENLPSYKDKVLEINLEWIEKEQRYVFVNERRLA